MKYPMLEKLAVSKAPGSQTTSKTMSAFQDEAAMEAQRRIKVNSMLKSLEKSLPVIKKPTLPSISYDGPASLGKRKYVSSPKADWPAKRPKMFPGG